ncbi:MAG: hypothetical protein WCH99_16860 [Verrucomicrobiota bacterium]
MKIKNDIIIMAGICGLCLIVQSGLSQGALTPPGAPAPTMKTLAQIEPRTPISSVPYAITNSGSYYLTQNVTITNGNAISIFADNVMLDLNGFTITSDPNYSSPGTAIITYARNITIANGFIRSGITNNGQGVYGGNGFQYGIFNGPGLDNVRVTGVTASGLVEGIYLFGGQGEVVENCTVKTVYLTGIGADTVRGCKAMDCGSIGITSFRAVDCEAESVGSDIGLYARDAYNCIGSSRGGTGIYCDYTAHNCRGTSGAGTGAGIIATTAENCYGYNSSNGSGIYSTAAQNCYGFSSGGDGINVTATAINCYGHSDGSGRGIYAYAAQNCYSSSSGGPGLYTTLAENCYAYTTGTGDGIDASVAINSYGSAYAGYGIRCARVATGCFGYSSSYIGLSSLLANGCIGAGATPVSVSYKYNMP